MAEAAALPLEEFDLFAQPPIQGSVSERLLTKHRPLSVLDSKQIIEFVIPTAVDEYALLFDTYLYLRVKVTPKATSGTFSWNDLKFAKYPIASIFKSVEVIVGDKNLTLSPQTYPYRAYFETILKHGKRAQDTWLSAGAFDGNVFATVPSSQNDYTYEMFGRLHVDLANQPRAILGGCNLHIRLTPHSPDFYFIKSGTVNSANISFEECYLYMYRAKVSPEIVAGHTAALQVSPARYPITRAEVKAYTIQASRLEAFFDNVVVGQLPRRVFVALVNNAAFLGDMAKDPFKFEHFNTNYLSLYINGVQYPSIPFKPDFTNGTYIREYFEFLRAADQLTGIPQTTITRANYSNDNVIFGVNLTPDNTFGYIEDGRINEPRTGVLRLEIRFSSTLAEAVTALIYCEYDNNIYINTDRNAFTDCK